MPQTLTISCKLKVSASQAAKRDATFDALRTPSRWRERQTLNWVNQNTPAKVVNAVKLQSLCYKATNSAIALEELTGIRERTNHQPRSKAERRRSNRWAFHQLRLFVHYKANKAGVKGALPAGLYLADLPAVFVAWRAGRERFLLCQPRLWLGRRCRLQRRQCHCPFGGCCKPPTSPRLRRDRGGPWLACRLQGYCLRRGPEALSLLRAA